MTTWKGWIGTNAPLTSLPEDIVRHTQQKYMDTFHQLTGREIEAAPLALEE